MLPITLRIFPIHVERTSISKSKQKFQKHTHNDKGITVRGVTLPALH